MKIDLCVELHSRYCVCSGTGWLSRLLRAAQKCQGDCIIITYGDWLAMGKPATKEALLQNLEEGKSNKHVEFINTLCVAIEKELTPPPRPAPHIGEEQDKER